MAYPDKPAVSFDYSAFEQGLGDGSFPGQEIDVDLAALVASLSTTIDFLKNVMRADGKLANGIVTTDALAPSIRIGFDPPEPWAIGQDYGTRSTVFSGYGFYLCLIAHTSSDFATDLASGRWQLLADLTPPTPVGGALIAANNLADLASISTARANLGLASMALAVAGSGATEYRNNNAQDSLFQPVLGLGFRSISASETATTADLGRTLLVDPTSAAVTVTLPPAADCGPGKPWIQIVRTTGGANNVVIDPNGSETIMGASTMSMQNQWDAIIIQSNGTAWFVVGAHYFFTGFGKTLVNKGNAADVRTQIGLGTVATLTAVIAATGIAASNNDTSVPTSAAVKAYADAATASDVLGTLNFSAESTKSLSGLDLTKYKFVRLEFYQVTNSLSGNLQVNSQTIQTLSTTGAQTGGFDIELANGVSKGAVGGSVPGNYSPWLGDTTLANATTTLTVSISAGNLTGSVRVIGVK